MGENKEKTLENLIAECGIYFRAIILHTDYDAFKDRMKWHAKVNQRKAKISPSFGDTPEEAVWGMYIKLKAKNLIRGYKSW